jgi:hypothetical protein
MVRRSNTVRGCRHTPACRFSRLRAVVAAACLLSVAAASRGFGDWTTNFLYGVCTNGMRYRLFVPSGYSPTNQYPLLLYLHYAGNEGTNNQSHLYESGAAKTNWMTLPTFILCPQSDYDGSHGWPYGFAYEPEVVRARGCVVEAQATYSINPRRLYVSGVSAGGMGSWRIISIFTNTFAAAAPMVGRADVPDDGAISAWAPRLIHTPVWSFNGSDVGPMYDGYNAYYTQVMFEQIAQAVTNAGETVNTNMHRHTVYTDLGHTEEVCNRAVLNDGLNAWMFTKWLESEPPTAPTNVVATLVTYQRAGLAWTTADPPPTIDYFAIDRDGATAGATTNTSFTDGLLAPGSNYTYQVKAMNHWGMASSNSAAVVVQTLAADTPPQLTVLAPANDPAFAIGWHSISGRAYSVYTTTDLLTLPQSWSNVTDLVGDGYMLRYTNVLPATPRRFFQIRTPSE